MVMSSDPREERLLRRYVPIVGWLRGYERRWLVADSVAGLSVWALLVPQSLAYATIVGVPVQYGLYTAFAALLVYPLFGTSRHLVVGPSATVGAVSAAVVDTTDRDGRARNGRGRDLCGGARARRRLRLPRARPAADGLDLDLPLEGGDVRLHPRVRRSASSSTRPTPCSASPGSTARTWSSSGERSRRSRTRAARRSLSVQRRSRCCW